MKRLAGLIGLLAATASCTHYTPKPHGYFRIEPKKAVYKPFVSEGLPFTFNKSQEAVVRQSMQTDSSNWINIEYPELNATLYCSHLSITPEALAHLDNDNRRLIHQLLSPNIQLKEKSYSHPEEKVYGTLFLLEGETASPVHFTLTDSLSHFFRGALYFDCKPNADSLAPATDYLQHDIVELIQSFRWK